MSFVVKQEKFEGPLELLIQLIEREELSISEVSLAKVADEYLTLVRATEGVRPQDLAEFLVVAAQLMLVKSRTLLPGRSDSDEEEQTVEELQKRLEEYKKIRHQGDALAHLLKSRKNRIVARNFFAGVLPAFLPPDGVSARLLHEAFVGFLASLPQPKRIAKATIRAIVSLEERIAAISALIEGAVERTFADLTAGAENRTEMIVSFLALLELARQQKIALTQNEYFGEIVVRKV
ncbi:MAG: segregation/condensation protein A [Candidatus Sungbacteria bacterium]|nr:segregation/condensation protein A [Candidatus Sungbacteria bacterium]